MLPRFGQIVFGGNNVQAGRLFALNGNASSVTGNEFFKVGHKFTVWMPMRIFAMTCDRSIDFSPTSITIIRNNWDLHSWDFDRSSVAFVGTALDFDSGHSIMLSAEGRAPGACLITLYFRTFDEQIPRYLQLQSLAPQMGNAPGLHTFTFGGHNVSVNMSHLRFNGNAYSPVNTAEGGAGNMFVVGAPMTINRVFWDKTNAGPTEVQILHGLGIVLQTFTMNLVNDNTSLNVPVMTTQGLQVRYSGRTPPGTCLLTFYAQPSISSPAPGGIIHFGGVVKKIGNFLCANGNGTSVVNSQENAVGNVSVIGVRSRPYAIAWNTRYATIIFPYGTPTLQVLRNNSPIYILQFLGDGTGGVRNITQALTFDPGDTMQVRFVDGRPTEESVVSLYMTPM